MRVFDFYKKYGKGRLYIVYILSVYVYVKCFKYEGINIQGIMEKKIIYVFIYYQDLMLVYMFSCVCFVDFLVLQLVINFFYVVISCLVVVLNYLENFGFQKVLQDIR